MPSASWVLTNGRIATGHPALPEAEALAVSNERVVRIGPARTVEPLIGRRTRVFDARGRRVLPGFVDAHAHLIFGYELGEWVDLTGQPARHEIRRRIREHARRRPDEPMLVGYGFDYAAVASDRLPTKEELDAIVDDRPALLFSWDGHTGWANSRFFARALPRLRGLDPSTGEILRNRSTGEPTGILRRAFDLTDHLPEFDARRSVAGLERMLRRALEAGVTTAFDVQVHRGDLEVYDRLSRRGKLGPRIRAAIYHPRGTPARDYSAFLAARTRYRGNRFEVAAVKLYIDGVQETGTAALLEPYSNDPSSCGSTVYSVREFRRIVRALDRLGFQVLTHACGDRGVRLALDAYAEAARTNRTSGRRHRIEHCENLAAEDIGRFASLGVIPCMMPRHSAPELTRRWRLAVGPDRTRAAFPWLELLAAGASLAFASDWPVAELEPMVGIDAAVNRVDPDGQPSAHRLSVAEAVHAYTAGSAYASHCEGDRGRLAVGTLADLVLLDRDPFEVPPGQLRSVRIEATVIGGTVVMDQTRNARSPAHR